MTLIKEALNNEHNQWDVHINCMFWRFRTHKRHHSFENNSQEWLLAETPSSQLSFHIEQSNSLTSHTLSMSPHISQTHIDGRPYHWPWVITKEVSVGWPVKGQGVEKELIGDLDLHMTSKGKNRP